MLRDTLAGSLQQIAAKTEGLYLSLSATYPEMVREMRASLSGNHASGLDESDLLKQIEETMVLINQLSAEFQETYEKDMAVYTVLESQMEEIRHLGQFISQIREDSSAMELISLNAMTVALKAGSSGRAFSFITEELKRLSSRTIELTQTVTEQGNVLLRHFADFSEKLKNSSRAEQEIFGGFRERMDSSFDGFKVGVRAIVDLLNQLRGNTDFVFKPLMKIMEEIQKQDLIRQSIDHVIISLDELRAIKEDASDEELLDEYYFLKSLPQLCMGVLKDIRAMVEESRNIFNQQLEEAQIAIDGLEDQRRNFIQRSLDSNTTEGLEYHFSQSTQVMSSLNGDMADVFTQKKRTVEASKDMIKKVRGLDEIFKSFSSLTTRFHTIDVASRIEIAKQEVLKRMAGTVDEMTRLTSQIETDVEKSLQVTTNFMDNVQRSFEGYRSLFTKQMHVSHRSIERLKQKHALLLRTKDSLVTSIVSFRIFTDVFMGKFQQSRKDLAQVDLLLSDIDQIYRSLDTVRLEADNGLQGLLQARGISTWQLRDQRLKKVIERFTIFTHKKIAGDLAGFEVEAGVTAGDVTLF